MDIRVAGTAFFIVATLIYALMNYYVLSRLARLVGVRGSWRLAVIVTISTLSLFAAFMVQAHAQGTLARMLYIGAMSWAGALFIVCCLVLLQKGASRIWRLKPRTWERTILVVGGLLVILSFASASYLNVHEVALKSPKVAQPVRLVQITDVHLGPVYGAQRVHDIVERIRPLHPDAVVITGDLIDGPGTYDPSLLKPFDELGAPVYFVTGNHEGYAGATTVDKLLADTSIVHLRDEHAEVRGVEIIGVDDTGSSSVVMDELAAVPRNNSMYTVLLSHRPSASTAVQGIDLILSGHTHAGQIFPFTLLTMLIERPVVGLHARNDGLIYVSPGTGTWGPPMRLGTLSEVTLITISPDAAAR